MGQAEEAPIHGLCRLLKTAAGLAGVISAIQAAATVRAALLLDSPCQLPTCLLEVMKETYAVHQSSFRLGRTKIDFA
jgi:hypothetical protein